MADFGGTDADSLKKAIDGVFDLENGKVKLTQEEYTFKVIGSTADGASVNFGIHKGLLTQLARTRPWMLKVHCVNHRVELAFKESIKDSTFDDVDKLYLTLYYLLRDSGRFNSECKHAGEAVNVEYYKLPKIHGTRFVGHRRAGLTKLLHDWPVFMVACENAVVATRSYQPKTKAKIQGILEKLRNYRILTLTAAYLDLMEKATPISKVFETEHVMPYEVKGNVARTKLELEDLVDSVGTPEELLDSHLAKFVNIQTDEDGKNFIEIEYLKVGELRKKPANRDCPFYLTISNLKNASEQVRESASREKKRTSQELMNLIDTRFADFNSEIYKSMSWMDRTNWTEEPDYAYDQLRELSTYFEEPLEHAGYNSANIIREWKSCRRLIITRFPDPEISSRLIWKHILLHRQDEFPNLFILVSLVSTVSISNSSVERAFSTLTMMMGDRRLNLGDKTLEHSIIVKGNDKLWSDRERADLIERALEIYMSKRRSTTMDGW